MDWLIVLFRDNSIAHAVLVLALVVAVGLAAGHVKFRGIGLGVGGVLFSGLAFGHFGMTITPDLLEFIREFGLILFVYAIGLQVGPGFLSSLRRQGLVLNLLAASVVVGGTLVAIAIAFLTDIELPAVVGMLSGAVTNTPSLGAAQQAFREVGASPEATQTVGMAYAVAYPFGILGIILSMLVLRRVFRIDTRKEAQEFDRLRHDRFRPLLTRDVEITNTNLEGRSVQEILRLTGSKVVISRVLHGDRQEIATPDTVVHLGGIVHVVGTEQGIDHFRTVVGRESALGLPRMESPITVKRAVVTRGHHVGTRLEDLELERRFGVVVSRVIRSGIEFTPTRGLRIQFGDRLSLVGYEEKVERASEHLGNAVQDLDRPHIIPIFIGIALGVVVGSIPFQIPSVPAPVKLGLAGGPLLVAIILGRIGRIGPFLSHVPNGAKKLLAEFGISLFLAAVGLKSGERFVDLLVSGDGLLWMAWGSLITMIPLLVVGVVARLWKRLDFVSISGLLSGSMTDPPALAYATSMVGNDSPSITYATVYPLTMILRVLLAQLIVLFW